MSILPETNHQKIYVGSKINAQFLQSLLLESDIKSVIRDDGESAARAGFAMDYMNGAKLLVAKGDLLQAKHIIDTATDEEGNLNAVDEEFLAERALSSKKNNTANQAESLTESQERPTYRRSPLNLLLNIGIILYSLYRLYPITQGEELPGWRIALSGGLLLFCSWAVYKHLTATKKSGH
ncbi:MAG: hypothetical protein ACI828_000423 [Flavobacteriales bacterium]|jgi:hypothetical protein